MSRYDTMSEATFKPHGTWEEWQARAEKAERERMDYYRNFERATARAEKAERERGNFYAAMLDRERELGEVRATLERIKELLRDDAVA